MPIVRLNLPKFCEWGDKLKKTKERTRNPFSFATFATQTRQIHFLRDFIVGGLIAG